VVGPLTAGAGGILVLIGFISFISAIAGSGSPVYFVFAVIGLPILGIGVMITKFAYMGRIMRICRRR